MTGLVVSRMPIQCTYEGVDTSRIFYQYSKVPSLYNASKVSDYIVVKAAGHKSGKKFPVGICHRAGALRGLSNKTAIEFEKVTLDGISHCYDFLSHGFVNLHEDEERNFVRAAIELQIVGFIVGKDENYDDAYLTDSDVEDASILKPVVANRIALPSTILQQQGSMAVEKTPDESSDSDSKLKNGQVENGKKPESEEMSDTNDGESGKGGSSDDDETAHQGRSENLDIIEDLQQQDAEEWHFEEHQEGEDENKDEENFADNEEEDGDDEEEEDEEETGKEKINGKSNITSDPDEEEEEEEEEETGKEKIDGKSNITPDPDSSQSSSSSSGSDSSSVEDGDGDKSSDQDEELREAKKKFEKQKSGPPKYSLKQIRSYNPYKPPTPEESVDRDNQEVFNVESTTTVIGEDENVIEVFKDQSDTAKSTHNSSPLLSIAKLSSTQIESASNRYTLRSSSKSVEFNSVESPKTGNSKKKPSSKERSGESPRTGNLNKKPSSKERVESPDHPLTQAHKHVVRTAFSSAELKQFASDGYTGDKLMEKLQVESYKRLLAKTGLTEENLATKKFGDFESNVLFLLQAQNLGEITRYGKFGFKRTVREVTCKDGTTSVMKSAEVCLACVNGMNNQLDAYKHDIKHGTHYSELLEFAQNDPTSTLGTYDVMHYSNINNVKSIKKSKDDLKVLDEQPKEKAVEPKSVKTVRRKPKTLKKVASKADVVESKDSEKKESTGRKNKKNKHRRRRNENDQSPEKEGDSTGTDSSGEITNNVNKPISSKSTTKHVDESGEFENKDSPIKKSKKSKHKHRRHDSNPYSPAGHESISGTMAESQYAEVNKSPSVLPSSKDKSKSSSKRVGDEQSKEHSTKEIEKKRRHVHNSNKRSSTNKRRDSYSPISTKRLKSAK